MKKFQFSLAKVLKVKERHEELKKEAFQQAQAKKNEKERLLNQLLNKRQQLYHELSLEKNGSIQIDKITQYYRYLSSLEDEITVSRHELMQAEEKLEQARLKWIEAKREKRVLEKLEERQYQEYKKENLKIEQKRLDELGIQCSYSR